MLDSEPDQDNRSRKKSRRDDPDIAMMNLPSEEQPRQITRQRQENSEERKDRHGRKERSKRKKSLNSGSKKESGMVKSLLLANSVHAQLTCTHSHNSIITLVLETRITGLFFHHQ